jgi:hypothetical protein
MLPWILVFFARWELGERFRRATSSDYRYWFASLALTPVFIGTFVFFPIGREIMDRGSVLAVWAYFVAASLVGGIILQLWAKWISATVSLALAVGVWIAAFLIAWEKI